MADILSTLRELRSLEEKRAHGTLSPEEEARFQELQATVSSRGSKPKPAAPTPAPSAGVPTVEMAEPNPSEGADAPFVDADLAEEIAEPASSPEPALAPPPYPPQQAEEEERTVVQAAPEPAEVTAVAAAPAPVGAASPDDRPVPMSPAELRQWNASFTPPQAFAPPIQEAPGLDPLGGTLAPSPEEPTSIVSPPPEVPMPSVAEWLAPTQPPASLESVSAGDIRSTATDDDAPAVWTDPAASAAPPAAALDSAQPSPELLPSEPAADAEPTRLVPASSSMDPTLADAFEPPPRAEGDGAEVTSKRMTPIGEAFAAGESRVVVHTLGGVQKRGSLVDAHMNADFLELRLPDGEREMLSTAGLKAVFFVVPIGQDVPTPVGDPVTVTLVDGHQLIGLSPDYQVGAVGFFLSPTDQRSRTAKIYIYAGAVKGIS